jgi:hypothetical protein
MTTNDGSLSFNKDEIKALRQMAEDWLGEELTLPPFPPATDAVLKKLGLAAPKLADKTSVADNQVTARPGPRSE